MYKKLYCYFLIIFLIFPTPAYAYIDPGVGSMILQGLAAGFCTLLVFWGRFRDRVFSIFRKNKAAKNTAAKNTEGSGS